MALATASGNPGTVSIVCFSKATRGRAGAGFARKVSMGMLFVFNWPESSTRSGTMATRLWKSRAAAAVSTMEGADTPIRRSSSPRA